MTLILRYWPIAAVAVLLFVVFRFGVNSERKEWEAEADRLRAVAAEESLARQQAVNAVNDALSRSEDDRQALREAARKEVDAYYKDRPAVQCFDADRLREINAARSKVAATAR